MVQQVISTAEAAVPAAAIWVGGIGAVLMIVFVATIWGMLRASKS